MANAANLSKDDIKWAQVELHNLGLYNGSLDGVVGPETERALLRFQKSNGLERTATLDQQTADIAVASMCRQPTGPYEAELEHLLEFGVVGRQFQCGVDQHAAAALLVVNRPLDRS